MSGKYDTRLDRTSAAEMLASRAAAAAKAAEGAEVAEAQLDQEAREHATGRRYTGAAVSRSSSRGTSNASGGFGEALASVLVKELKGTTGRRLVRGILGGLFKGR